MRVNKGIFISYRREEATAHAGWLADRLSEHFGEHKVFRDIDSIEPGLDFIEAIERAVGASEVVLVVIGKSWLTAADAAGRERLHNPNDYVRREIAAALQRNTRVLPVLIQGASMPRADELPDDLVALARRNAFELHDTSWRDDVQRLTNALENVVMSQGHAADKPIARPTERQKDGSKRRDGGYRTRQAGRNKAQVFSAIGAALAGVIWLGDAVQLYAGPDYFSRGSLYFYVIHGMALLKWIVTLVALIGIYLYVRKLTGYSRLFTGGLVGISIFAIYSIRYQVEVLIDQMLLRQAIPDPWFLTIVISMPILALGIGFLLLGIASIRGRFLPYWCSVVLFMGCIYAVLRTLMEILVTLDADNTVVISLVVSMEFLFGFIWLALSYAVWSTPSVPAEKN